MPNFIIRVKETGAKKAKKNVSGLNRALGSIKTAAMGAAVGLGAMKLAGLAMDAVKSAGEFKKLDIAFNNLNKSSGFGAGSLDKYKKALDGTVSSADMMKMANNAMLLGIADSNDQMADMFDMAQRLGAAVGEDATFGVNSLVTGMGRQSVLMLDNLGIMVDTVTANENYAEILGTTVDKLTDAEKKQAFNNETMRQAKILVGNLGDEHLTAADAMAAASTASKDAQIVIGEMLAPAIKEAALGFAGAATAVGDYLTSLQTLSTEEINASTNQEDLSDRIEKTKTKMELLNEQGNLNSRVGQELGRGIGDNTEKYGELESQLLRLEERYRALTSVMAPGGEFDMGNHQQYVETQAEEIRIAEEVAAAQAAITAKKIADGKALEVANKKAADLTAATKLQSLKDDLKNAALSGQSASESMKSVVRAKLMEGIASAMASVFKNPAIPFPLNMLAAAGVGGALTAAVDRNMAMIPSFAQGGDFVTSGSQMIMVGDNPSGREHVKIEPLDAGGEPTGGGGSVVVNFSGNVMSQDFIEDEAIPMIKSAIRRGADIGVA